MAKQVLLSITTFLFLYVHTYSYAKLPNINKEYVNNNELSESFNKSFSAIEQRDLVIAEEEANKYFLITKNLPDEKLVDLVTSTLQINLNHFKGEFSNNTDLIDRNLQIRYELVKKIKNKNILEIGDSSMSAKKLAKLYLDKKYDKAYSEYLRNDQAIYMFNKQVYKKILQYTCNDDDKYDQILSMSLKLSTYLASLYRRGKLINAESYLLQLLQLDYMLFNNMSIVQAVEEDRFYDPNSKLSTKLNYYFYSGAGLNDDERSIVFEDLKKTILEKYGEDNAKIAYIEYQNKDQINSQYFKTITCSKVSSVLDESSVKDYYVNHKKQLAESIEILKEYENELPRTLASIYEEQVPLQMDSIEKYFEKNDPKQKKSLLGGLVGGIFKGVGGIVGDIGGTAVELYEAKEHFTNSERTIPDKVMAPMESKMSEALDVLERSSGKDDLELQSYAMEFAKQYITLVGSGRPIDSRVRVGAAQLAAKTIETGDMESVDLYLIEKLQSLRYEELRHLFSDVFDESSLKFSESMYSNPFKLLEGKTKSTKIKELLQGRLVIFEKENINNKRLIGLTMFVLAHAYYNENDLRNTESVLLQSLSYYNIKNKYDMYIMTLSLHLLGQIYLKQGNGVSAEEVLNDALNKRLVIDSHLTPESISISGDLALALSLQNRDTEAIELLQQAISDIKSNKLDKLITEKQGIITNITNRVKIERLQGMSDVDFEKYSNVSNIVTDADMIRVRLQYAQLMDKTDNLLEAEKQYKYILKKLPRGKYRADLIFGRVVMGYVRLLMKQKQYTEAIKHISVAKEFIDRMISGKSFLLAEALGLEGLLLSITGDHLGALTAIQTGLSIVELENSTGLALLRENILADILKALNNIENNITSDIYIAQTFRAIQLLQLGETSATASLVAARFATEDSGLGQAIRMLQDIDKELKTIRQKRADSFINSDKNGNYIDFDEKERIAKRKLNETRVFIQESFPAYSELTSVSPKSIDQIKSILSPGEAILSIANLSDETYVVMLTKNKKIAYRAGLTFDETAGMTRKLRNTLSTEEIETLDDIKPYPTVLAYKLYSHLIKPGESLLENVNSLLVTPNGPLESLPFSILVTEETKIPRSFDEYRTIPWLSNRYALTTLPSVGSIYSLRSTARKSEATSIFKGYGDPVLADAAGGERGVKISKIFSRGAVANVTELRKLPSLPDTAKELKSIANTLNASDSVVLRGDATETNVKKASLNQYKYIAFATHGLLAQESSQFQGVAEPALVLTPPKIGTNLDDGLLTASEISQLKLDADWVLLSACNTAASDGSPSAEGLSGLAKSFIYAGARALLVSHWPVNSDSAVDLTTTAFEELNNDSSIGKSEALRRSMVKMINNKDKPYYAHPIFWAPYVVVGEGGNYDASKLASRSIPSNDNSRKIFDKVGDANIIPNDTVPVANKLLRKRVVERPVKQSSKKKNIKPLVIAKVERNEINSEPGLKPFVKTDFYNLVWTDAGSGARKDFAVFRPTPKDGYFALGDVAVAEPWENEKYGPPSFSTILIKEGSIELEKPIDYVKIWDSKGSKSDKPFSSWRPVSAEGHTCLGEVGSQSFDAKPSVDLIRCLPNNCVIKTKAEKRIWKDKGSGADLDYSAWRVPDVNLYVGHTSHKAITDDIYTISRSCVN
jgi:CHAT domain-containing protein